MVWQEEPPLDWFLLVFFFLSFESNHLFLFNTAIMYTSRKQPYRLTHCPASPAALVSGGRTVWPPPPPLPGPSAQPNPMGAAQLVAADRADLALVRGEVSRGCGGCWGAELCIGEWDPFWPPRGLGVSRILFTDGVL